MGDGATVTCTAPGTPYTPNYGAQPSPDCGHTYTRPGTLTATRATTISNIRTGGMQALTS